MKLNSLYIEDYKLLKNFSIAFNNDVSILIGINGSGKSTILEFLSNIFFDLYSFFVLANNIQKPSKYFVLNYEIEYESNKYEIHINLSKVSNEFFNISIRKNNGELYKYSKSKIVSEFINGYKDILPKNVVVYYSGISSILEDKYLSFQNDLIIRSLYGTVQIEQPFFYFLKRNFPAILIGLLSYQFGTIPDLLKTKFKISGFKKITIQLKKPLWAGKGEFWGAKGDLRNFLVRLEETSYLNTQKTSKLTDTYVLINQNDLENLWSPYGQEKNLFEYLVTLQANDLIETIEIILTKDGIDISYNCLSEGEKQLLIIYGLKELLITGNTLYLFDEPDTYLHPIWQRNFISDIFNVDQSNSEVKNQFLITTHSPQLLGNAVPEIAEVQIIEDGAMVKITPKYYGREIKAILYDMMGVESRNVRIASAISFLFNLIEEGQLEKANLEYNRLSELLGEDDVDLINAQIQIQYLKDSIDEKNK